MACRTGKTYRKNKLRVFALNLEKHGEYTCEYCKKSPLYRNTTGMTEMTPDVLTADHIVPFSKGGKNSIENLVACCFECNNKKGAHCA